VSKAPASRIPLSERGGSEPKQGRNLELEQEGLEQSTVVQRKVKEMSVAKVTEITSSSSKSFEDALQAGIKRANKTLENVQSAWIQDHEVSIKDGNITEYRVRMKITFILND
jgi:flavin-binding protein dodecin